MSTKTNGAVMKVSVVICTWNRSGLLDRTLYEMRALRIPCDVNWEILVVNNNSTDNTDEVIRKHQGALPIQCLFEPRAGKSYAANLALERCSGDLLIWTDDDVLVAPEWLESYVVSARQNANSTFFFGPIEPWFEQEPPAWILRHMRELQGVYAILTHLGPVAKPFEEGDPVYGANMAFRTRVAREFPLNPELGRIRHSLIGADDTELVLRVRASGHTGMWVPNARVRHFIPTKRLNKGYVAHWFFGAGQNFARCHGVEKGATVWGYPRWAVWKYIKAAVKSSFHLTKGPGWFASFKEMNRMRGYLWEARRRMVNNSSAEST
jgi:glycosyltransferase involved in cell wall biosynthesis